MKQKDPIKLMVTIVHHGKGDSVAKQFGKDHVGTHYVCHGFGTASSEVMDYLGIGEPEKDIVFSLVPLSQAKRIMEDVREGMSLHLPGRGITFILPLTAVSKIIERTLHSNVTEEEREEEVRMENQGKFSMIMVMINRGYTDTVMEAAKAAGARGGTVVHAREVNAEGAEEFLGVKLDAEREFVMLLVRQKDKTAIMSAIGKVAGIHSKARGILFSLPVEDFDGIS